MRPPALTHARTLEAAEGWSSLAEADREQILRANDLLEPPALAIGSDDELADSLDRQSLERLGQPSCAPFPTALEDALLELARRLEPAARRVRLRRRR